MIAVIADDFTGAAEIAGLGWRHGLRADLLTRTEKPTDADLVVYDADSRNCSPTEARRRVADILKRLRSRKSEAKANLRSSRREEALTSQSAIGNRQSAIATGLAPEWVFKKVDSVLRGNVIAEIEAALAALKMKRCLLVPANPNAGRIIRGGRYYIHGTPLHRTDFRNDPRHPRRSSRVLDLLGQPPTAALAIRRAGTKTLRDGITVGEVAECADVQHWAGLADEETLAVGGADFFRALLLKHKRGNTGHRSGKRRQPPATRRAGGRRSNRDAGTLFVCGSLAESSRTFLAGCRGKGWPVLLMPDGLLAAGKHRTAAQATWARQIIRAVRQRPNVVVGIGRPRLAGKQTPLRLGRILTDTVRQVLSTARPGRLCVEGGATAALLLERMGWRRMSVEVEYATGVTGARPHRCPDLLLVCKPGSYAWPEALVD